MASFSITVHAIDAASDVFRQIAAAAAQLQRTAGGAAGGGAAAAGQLTQQITQPMRQASNAIQAEAARYRVSVNKVLTEAGKSGLTALSKEMKKYGTEMRGMGRAIRTPLETIFKETVLDPTGKKIKRIVPVEELKARVKELRAELPKYASLLRSFGSVTREAGVLKEKERISAIQAMGDRARLYSKNELAQMKVDAAAQQNAIRERKQGIDRFVRSTIAVGSRAIMAVEQAFLSRGFFGAVTRSLFAPLAGVKRGFDELGRAASTAFSILSRPSFRAATDSFRVLGGVIRGVTETAGALVAQLGRLVGLPFRLVGSIVGEFGSVFGKLFGAGLGGIGKLLGVAGDVAGEFIAIAGKAMGGLAEVVAAGLKPIAGLFDLIISPITTTFWFIGMAWRFSLVAMTGFTIAFIKKSVDAFTEFERRVTMAVAQIPNAAAGSFERFAGLALGMSRDLGKSATEINDALRLAVSVGFESVAEASDVATAATRLATASFTEIRTATEALTNIMNSYGKAGKDAAGVSDMLMRGWQVAGGEMGDFASGLGIIASSVAAASGSMEDLIAFTALLTRSAAGSSRIFIETQQAFQKLVAPSNTTMAMLGLAPARNQAGGIDLLTTLTNIKTKLDAMSGGDAMKRYQIIAKMFPDERERRAIARFFAASKSSIEEVFRAVRSPAGAVGAALGLQDPLISRQMERLKAAFERLKITVGQALKPIWIGAIQGLRTFLDGIEQATTAGRFKRLGESIRNLFGVGVGPGNFTERIITFFGETLPDVLENRVVPAIRSAFEWLDRFTGGFRFWATIANMLDLVADAADGLDAAFKKLGFGSIDESLKSIAKSLEKIVNKGEEIAAGAKGAVEGLGVGARNVGKVGQAAGVLLPKEIWGNEFMGVGLGPTGPVVYPKGPAIRGALGWLWDVLTGETKNTVQRPPGGGGGPREFQHGGIVPGLGRGDRVPIWAEPGELVVPRDVVEELRMVKRQLQNERESGVLRPMGRWQKFKGLFSESGPLGTPWWLTRNVGGYAAMLHSGSVTRLSAPSISARFARTAGFSSENERLASGARIAFRLPKGRIVVSNEPTHSMAIDDLLARRAISRSDVQAMLNSARGYQSGFLRSGRFLTHDELYGLPKVPADLPELFQHGGIVPGTGNSDNVPIWARPGELIVPPEVWKRSIRAGGRAAQGGVPQPGPLSDFRDWARAGAATARGFDFSSYNAELVRLRKEAGNNQQALKKLEIADKLLQQILDELEKGTRGAANLAGMRNMLVQAIQGAQQVINPPGFGPRGRLPGPPGGFPGGRSPVPIPQIPAGPPGEVGDRGLPRGARRQGGPGFEDELRRRRQEEIERQRGLRERDQREAQRARRERRERERQRRLGLVPPIVTGGAMDILPMGVVPGLGPLGVIPIPARAPRGRGARGQGGWDWGGTTSPRGGGYAIGPDGTVRVLPPTRAVGPAPLPRTMRIGPGGQVIDEFGNVVGAPPPPAIGPAPVPRKPGRQRPPVGHGRAVLPDGTVVDIAPSGRGFDQRRPAPIQTPISVTQPPAGWRVPPPGVTGRGPAPARWGGPFGPPEAARWEGGSPAPARWGGPFGAPQPANWGKDLQKAREGAKELANEDFLGGAMAELAGNIERIKRRIKDLEKRVKVTEE